MTCIHPIYPIEQYTLSIWSLVLLGMYGTQVKHNMAVREVFGLQENAFYVLKRLYKVGDTHTILQWTGVLSSFILVVRMLDPIPVWGIYPPTVVDFLSHLTTAITLSGMLQGLRTLTNATLKRSNIELGRFFAKLAHLLSIITITSAISTSLVFFLVTDILFWSDAINIAVIATVFAIFIIGFRYTLWKMKQFLPVLHEFESTTPRTIKESIRKAMRAFDRLNKLWWITFAIICVIWAIQFMIIWGLLDMGKYQKPNKNRYKVTNAIFLYLQIISLTVMLKYAWIPVDMIGTTSTNSALISVSEPQEPQNTTMPSISEGQESVSLENLTDTPTPEEIQLPHSLNERQYQLLERMRLNLLVSQ